MNNPIDDIFDSRDLTEYKEYLADELLSSWNDWQEEYLNNEYEADDIDEALAFIDKLADNGFEFFQDSYSTDIEEYKNINTFCAELSDYSSDFEYGEAIIREDYFTQYAEDFCKDCGLVPSDLSSLIEDNLDWDGIAEDLKQDYTSVEYDGDTYYIR